MNFLAHCLIADRAAVPAHPDLIAGGFIGDFLKGPVPADLPAALSTGVRLHRRIDAFSNDHPLIRRSCDRFPPPLRRFAPIFVDVVADHLLARHWQSYHPDPLSEFTASAYSAIAPHVHRLPDRGRRFFGYMAEHDLLAGYRRHAGMERALEAIVRRLRRPPDAPAVVAAVNTELAGLEEDFLAYFPDLVRHAAAWLAAGAVSAER